MKNFLLFFAPKFKKIGCDLANNYIDNVKDDECKVHGICTGLDNIADDITRDLGASLGYLWNLTEEETKWIDREYSDDVCNRFEKELGDEAFGRIITSDRRIGRGFVRGGICRPDYLADKVANNSCIASKKYVLGLYLFFEKVLKETKADSVFCYVVAGAPALMLGMLCEARNIPFSRLSPTRIGAGYVVDPDPMDRVLSVAKAYENTLVGKLDLSSYILEARKLLESFRNKPEPPGYMAFNNSSLSKSRLLNSMIKALKSTIILSLNIIMKRVKFNDGRKLIRRSWFNVNTQWKRKRINRKYFSIRDSFEGKYIFYPLHVEPESSTMVLSPWHTDQLTIIESLAKSAPINMTIVVKEHLPMLGLRPKGFYESIARMPRVKLLSPFEDSLSLIKSASLVTVITGTAAWEAMRLGVPAIIFGNSPYLAINEGVKYEPNLSNLYKSIPEAIKMSKASDKKLELYIAAALYKSFDLRSSLLWGDYESHTDEERQFVVNKIVQGIFDIESSK